MLFSFLFFSLNINSQIFVRNYDHKIYDSVILQHEGKNIEINTSNFKNFSFDGNDKVLFNGNLLDFSVSHDTLCFFEKVIEVEGIILKNENSSNKKVKIIKSEKLKNHSGRIFVNQYLATYVNINSYRKTFVKSITFFPEMSIFPHDIKGYVDIKIAPNKNGFPDSENPILSFQTDISKSITKKWEITFPKIIKYPKEGFFVTFYYSSLEDKERTTDLKLDKDSFLYFYYPQYKEWRKMNINGYQYKLKVLQ